MSHFIFFFVFPSFWVSFIFMIIVLQKFYYNISNLTVLYIPKTSHEVKFLYNEYYYLE